MKQQGKIPEGALLVTLDVVALYPNIPMAQGIAAAKEALEKSRPGKNVKPSNKSLIKLLELVLFVEFYHKHPHTWLRFKDDVLISAETTSRIVE